MPTGDQLQEIIGPLFVACCTGVFAIGTTLTVLWIIERSKAGSSGRRSRHRKGARFHKPHYIPVKTIEKAHPYAPIAYMSSHVRRTTIGVLTVTKVLPKIEVKRAIVRR